MDSRERICKLIECKLVETEKNRGVYNIEIEVVCELIRCKNCKHWEREKLGGNELRQGTCYSIELLNCINGSTYNVDDFQLIQRLERRKRGTGELSVTTKIISALVVIAGVMLIGAIADRGDRDE